MGKEAYYFSHDSNARYDQKMLQLRSVYGGEGYGWYWILIEMMRDANAFRLQYDGKYAFTAIRKELECSEDQAKKFVDDCISEFGLFSKNDGFFYSESLLRRMGEVEAKREKARKSANARWERNADAMRTHCEGNAIKERKGKEKKSKNTPIPPKGAEGENLFSDLPQEWVQDFQWFWDTYGKKTGRSKCEQTFKKLSLAERALIRNHLPKYVALTPELKYRKDPARYLNGKHWGDELEGEATAVGMAGVEEAPGKSSHGYKMVY